MELRCLSLVKAGLISHSDVLQMSFDDFERLEAFNIMTNNIQKSQYNQKDPSLSGKTTPKKGGLSVRNNGTYTRE